MDISLIPSIPIAYILFIMERRKSYIPRIAKGCQKEKSSTLSICYPFVIRFLSVCCPIKILSFAICSGFSTLMSLGDYSKKVTFWWLLTPGLYFCSLLPCWAGGDRSCWASHSASRCTTTWSCSWSGTRKKTELKNWLTKINYFRVVFSNKNYAFCKKMCYKIEVR